MSKKTPTSARLTPFEAGVLELLRRIAVNTRVSLMSAEEAKPAPAPKPTRPPSAGLAFDLNACNCGRATGACPVHGDAYWRNETPE